MNIFQKSIPNAWRHNSTLDAHLGPIWGPK
jgi:hypothetical protein